MKCRDRARRHRRIGLGVLTAIALLGASSGPASAANWIGATHGRVSAASRWVSGGSSWHGDFWFSTDRRGDVHGYAIVAYQPAIDVSGLNNAIAYIKSVTGAALGAVLGPFAPVVNTVGLGQIVGVAVSFRETSAIRQGPLSGSLHGGQLRLNWSAPLKGVPYDIVFQLVSTNQHIGGGTAPIHNPFRAAARMLDRRHALNATESSTSKDGVATMTGSYWVAHRVS